MTAAATPGYVLISPVKDEERYVELTLRSVVAQTLQPALWVIVDDGSTDGTVAIVQRYVERYPFIRLVRHPKSGVRQTGSAVIRAFNFGQQHIGACDHGFVVKLDCDLSFPPEYFKQLLRRFDDDPKLGIASGVYLEEAAPGSWTAVKMPSYHAFGACKVMRKACFEEIGGFVAAAGWDTVDEIRAWHRGWRTGHFEDLQVRHHKREGSGIGQLRTNRMHGEIFFVTGGDPLFLIFKVIHRIATRPFVIGAANLLFGYCAAAVRGVPRLVSSAEARGYRGLLRQRLFGRAPNVSIAQVQN
jgi:glycosyltransferase involved in cell wall biosynthesis